MKNRCSTSRRCPGWPRWSVLRSPSYGINSAQFRTGSPSPAQYPPSGSPMRARLVARDIFQLSTCRDFWQLHRLRQLRESPLAVMTHGPWMLWHPSVKNQDGASAQGARKRPSHQFLGVLR